MNYNSNIGALIQLLDDPDEGVFAHVKGKIKEIGEVAIPNLEDAWETNVFGVLFQSRIESLIHEIQFENLSKHLKEWKDGGSSSLLDGALLINRYQYPDFDQAEVLKTLEQIQQDIWLELNPNLTAFEQVKVINHILFDIYKFVGNTEDYHSPKNSFLSVVLESKKGNPLSLCLIYSIICQNLDLPIYGVNLPRHFVLGYIDRFSLYKTGDVFASEVLFYINPFSRGAVFSRAEIDHFLEQLKVETLDDFYRPSKNISIITRALNNLLFSYKQENNLEKQREIEALLHILK